MLLESVAEPHLAWRQATRMALAVLRRVWHLKEIAVFARTMLLESAAEQHLP
jgi:hypothetical protein